MFQALFGRKSVHRDAHAIYGAVVARARDSRLYTDFGVPDTFDGRFEMLVLHLYLLHARLKEEDDYARSVSQQVFDNFIDDMDQALREAAVSDVVVPKRIGKMTRVFYGRVGAFDEVFAQESPLEPLVEVLQRNLFPDSEPTADILKLATYMLGEHQTLDELTAAEIAKDHAVFSNNDLFDGVSESNQ